MSRLTLLIVALLVLAFGIIGCEKTPLAESTLLVPLKVTTPWPDQVISRLTPPAIQLLVKGAATDLTTLEKSTITYSIDRQPDQPGLHQIPIELAKLLLPEGITAIKATPSTVTLKTEAKVTKLVTVTPQLDGTPAAGLTLTATTVIPATVEITGGTSRVAQLDQITTDPIAIDNITKTLHRPEVKLIVPEGVTVVDPETVEITVNLAVEQATRTWPNLDVATRGSQHPVTIHPNKIALTVRGPIATLDRLNKGRNVDLFVDLTELNPGVYVRRAVIRLPLEVVLVEAKPVLFTITISDQPKS